MKLEKILVPVDGSPASDAAVELTIASAHEFNAQIDFVGLVDSTSAANFGNVSEESSDMMAAERGRLILGLAKDKAEKAGARYTTQIVKGVPYQVLAGLSADHDLMIMGIEPKGLFKSHANIQAVKTVQNAQCPVLTLKKAGYKLESILLAVYDGNGDDVDMAIVQAKATGAKLWIIGVDAAAAVSRAADRCKAAGVDAETETAKGNPSKIVVESSKEHGLVILNVEGHRRLAEDVMFKADCPVLLVGKWDADAQRRRRTPI